MHSASAKIDGEPYALRGARTVRGEALGNLFSIAEQGALRLLHKKVNIFICLLVVQIDSFIFHEIFSLISCSYWA